MSQQKFYYIIKGEGEKYTVALPTNDLLSIYCYLDRLISNGKRWRAYFATESYVRKLFKPIDSEFDKWEREE